MTTPLPVRNTDPDTSRDAAKTAVRRRTTVREAVFGILALCGPLTLDGLIVAYQRYSAEIMHWPAAAPSSIRTRCSELARDGRVEMVPDIEGRSAMGNRAKLWRVVA